jgi:hypothetical protein
LIWNERDLTSLYGYDDRIWVKKWWSYLEKSEGSSALGSSYHVD